METVLLPKLEGFAPELLLISAGFDAHMSDPLAQLQFSDADYQWATEQLMQVAEKSAPGRVVSARAGGYVLQALARASAAHVRALMVGCNNRGVRASDCDQGRRQGSGPGD